MTYFIFYLDKVFRPIDRHQLFTLHVYLILSLVKLNSVRQHYHFITQGSYKAICFDYRLFILRPILSIVSQDATHTK